ncbi:hypothetical protein T265_01650 [Opisthorchis viverrini]|uniref:Peptidase M12B domain-containing protein n=1 Tax=Opisthorchis viverrini TaxID=6198 RepID=A0A074ZYT5_OPIVI|nr:hypothetical protein T265_01650 [Opisthorchis viverrini]KER32216.1 hypothetical protein T265_01650 [Opisthorchis viverrini]
MPRLAIWIGFYLVCIENSAFRTSGYSAEEELDDLDEEPSGGRRMKECSKAWNASSPSTQSHLWIETMVVVDPSVRNRFDTIEQAQLYVQTLMQMTNDLLHHNSLGTNLSISVREIVWISERESSALLWGPSLIRSVHRFCKWALVNHYVKYNYDHALLLSRNIVQAAGISPLGHMCHMQYSCTLAEDSGFFSAYPIAHEIMHSLGIEHDGDGNSCDQSGRTGNIMAPLILSASHNHHWSVCTRRKLKKIRSLNRLECLEDFPIGRDQFAIDGFPGWQWSLDEQCRVSTGSNASRHCSKFGEHPCRELWCFMPEPIGKCSKILNHGMLDGTTCGDGKECIRGDCKEIQQPPLISTVYDEYEAWTTCSRSCGTGTQYRRKRCHGFRVKATKTLICDTKHVEYRLCYNEKATNCHTAVDDREFQCSRYNQFKLRGVFHTWLPVVNQSAPCQLLCRSEQTEQILDARTAVRDGTPCGYETPDARCVQAQCVKFDCLGVVNGKATRDRCGTCQGDGSSCKTIRHTLVRNLTHAEGYPIVHILPGFVREIRLLLNSSNHVLGLFDTSRMKFLFRGDFQTSTRNTTTSTTRRVLFGTEFTFQTFQTADGAYFSSVVATGPILGDMAVRIRQLVNNPENTKLILHIKYTVVENN